MDELTPQEVDDLTHLVAMLTSDAEFTYTTMHFGNHKPAPGSAEQHEAQAHLDYLNRVIAWLAKVAGPAVLPTEN